MRDGFDLVQGCRLPAGGGVIAPGAMPFLHRWCGNPVFSRLARWWFKAPVHDVYCGLRGFTKAFYERLEQRCTGHGICHRNDHQSESVSDAALLRFPLPCILTVARPTPRTSKTFRDGWRTLRFFLMYSPRWLFLMPGLWLMVLGCLGYAIAMPGWTFRGVIFDAHTLLFASLAILCGYQSVIFAVLTKTFAISEGLMPAEPATTRVMRWISLERGLLASLVTLVGVSCCYWHGD